MTEPRIRLVTNAEDPRDNGLWVQVDPNDDGSVDYLRPEGSKFKRPDSPPGREGEKQVYVPVPSPEEIERAEEMIEVTVLVERCILCNHPIAYGELCGPCGKDVGGAFDGGEDDVHLGPGDREEGI